MRCHPWCGRVAPTAQHTSIHRDRTMRCSGVPLGMPCFACCAIHHKKQSRCSPPRAPQTHLGLVIPTVLAAVLSSGRERLKSEMEGRRAVRGWVGGLNSALAEQCTGMLLGISAGECFSVSG